MKFLVDEIPRYDECPLYSCGACNPDDDCICTKSWQERADKEDCLWLKVVEKTDHDKKIIQEYVDKAVKELDEIKSEYDCIANEFQRGATSGASWMKKRAIEIVKDGVENER